MMLEQQKKIDIALNYEKTIIGIKPSGNERIPEKISRYANMINWNFKSLIDAIKIIGMITLL